jgi:hypothetical protein
MKSSMSAFASRCLVANLSWLTLHSWALNYWTAFWILLRMNHSGSESESLYDWWFTANQFVLATSALRLTTSNFIFQLNTCSCSPCGTSSLMWGWACRLQLLLVLASAVILRSESRGTHGHILAPNLEGQVPVFISHRKRWPSHTSRHCVPYDSQGYGGGIQPSLHAVESVMNRSSLHGSLYSVARIHGNLCWFRRHGKRVPYQVGFHQFASP